MKFKIILLAIIITTFTQCENNAKIERPLNLLDKKIERSKWELYKSNMNINFIIDTIYNPINFLQCDLERFINPMDSSMMGYLKHDTVKVISLFPFYKGHSLELPPKTFYGVAFKEDDIKYLIIDDDIFSKIDSASSKKQEEILISLVKNNKTKVNSWITQYVQKK